MDLPTLQQIVGYIFNTSVPENYYFYYLTCVLGLAFSTLFIIISTFGKKYVTGYSSQYYFHLLISRIGCFTFVYFLVGQLLIFFSWLNPINLLASLMIQIPCILLTEMFMAATFKRGFLFKEESDLSTIHIGLVFVSIILVSLLTPAPFEERLILGNINMDMNLNSTDENVPIYIKMSGPDSGLSVTIFRDSIEGLNEISSLTLNSGNSSLQFNKSMVGYWEDTGKYHIDLNKSSLSHGYYELKFENAKHNKINLKKIIQIK